MTENEKKTAAETSADKAPADKELTVEDLVPGLEEALAEGPVDLMAERIAALEGELAETKDRMLRALAETENVRRRAERDRKDAEAYGGTRLARDILAVFDNLNRALKAADDDLRANHGGFLEGVELTQRELVNAFAKHKIAPVEPEIGEKFDPNRHQAMFEAPIPGAKAGTIVEVMQAGFSIADRLLRPALVGVAKAAPEAKPAEETSDAPAADGPAEDPKA